MFRQIIKLWIPVLLVAITGLTGCQQSVRPSSSAWLGTSDRPQPIVSPQQAADVQIALGRSLEKRGDVHQAMAAYQEAVKFDKKRADAYLRMAILHDKQGKWKEATPFYETALGLAPKNPDIYCALGYSLYLQGFLTEAEITLRHALDLNLDYAQAHNNLALVLAAVGSYDESLAEFRKGGCDELDAHSNLAFMLTMDKQWTQARAEYQRVLGINPTYAPAKEGLKELNLVAAKFSWRQPAQTAAAGTRAIENGYEIELASYGEPTPRPTVGPPWTIE